ncbi:hypothetical protein J2Z21_004644 [Streptomyces griseochromogenes]|uniref:Uncharacterized protein n=1 Tax=Streptomyces griseochromogenes TaxID=68214 RepID=A0ABS4LW80_9ACTN|nr:hypothetical protein [Streptomyces griseochromogenes]
MRDTVLKAGWTWRGVVFGQQRRVVVEVVGRAGVVGREAVALQVVPGLLYRTGRFVVVP